MATVLGAILKKHLQARPYNMTRLKALGFFKD
jgi:hypothetical protein